MGGRRGKQLQVLTDGTFFINRWFATVEVRPKTLIPIGTSVLSFLTTAAKERTSRERDSAMANRLSRASAVCGRKLCRRESIPSTPTP